MTNQNNAAQPLLTDDAIERIRIRAEKDSRRFGHTVDIPIRADLLLALLSKLRAPVADERALPPLPKPYAQVGKFLDDATDVYTAEQMQAFGRAAPASAPVAGEAVSYRVLRKDTIDGQWKADGRGWCDGEPSRDLVDALAKCSDNWRIERAYAAPQASEAVRDADPIIGHITVKGKGRSSIDLDASHADLPEGEYVIRAALSAQPANKPAISSPSSAGNPCPAPVPAYPETGNSHTDGGAVYG